MLYSTQNAAFRKDKQQFFASLPASATPLAFAEQFANNKDYKFLLQNQLAIETEFTQMFAVLQKQKSKNKEAFWAYCYYCASLLESYYKAYGQQIKASEFSQIKEQIKARLKGEAKAKASEESFIESLRNKFISSIKGLATSPAHISQVRDNVAYANLCRLYWVFCRLTLVQGFKVVKDLELIDKLDVILGTHTDIDRIIATIQAPNGFLNYFSVGLFLTRFLIDGGLLIKHTFFPTELEKGAEKGSTIHKLDSMPAEGFLNNYSNSYLFIPSENTDRFDLYYITRSGVCKKLEVNKKGKESLQMGLLIANSFNNDSTSVHLEHHQVNRFITSFTGHIPEATTALDRFKHELYKRHCNFANDLVWAVVNFLTNFNHISKVPGSVTGYVTAVFLIFDISLLLYRCSLAKKEYLNKKGQYEQERADYNNLKLYPHLSDEQRRNHLEMLDRQLKELEINWQTKEAMFHFAAAAAVLLFAGFSLSLLVSGPALVLAGYFICQIAVAMYLSTGTYAQFSEKSLRLDQAKLIGEDLALALKEYEVARNEFIFAMVKNTVMPTILITTFAICWPAAIVLTAVYMGYEMYHAYSQHSGNKAAKQLAYIEPETVEEQYNTVENNYNLVAG